MKYLHFVQKMNKGIITLKKQLQKMREESWWMLKKIVHTIKSEPVYVTIAKGDRKQIKIHSNQNLQKMKWI